MGKKDHFEITKSIFERAKELEEYWTQFPDWYWKSGLHDALIHSVSEIQLFPDYKDKQSKRNCLEILLDSKNAIYENDIIKIRLFNYKIKTPLFDAKTLEKVWWMDDSLEKQENGHYLSEIEVENANGERIKLTVSFELAEVIRK